MKRVTGIALLLLAGCATPEGSYRPNRQLLTGSEQFNVKCEGDFDEPPRLVSGKSPVFPIRMLNPDVIEDRKIRRLPMEWPVTSTLEVDAEGRTSNVHSSASEPPSFSKHMTAAVDAWRFRPAMLAASPTPSRCSITFTYRLTG